MAVESSKTDTPKSGQPLYNGQTSWNEMNLPYTYVMVKHSPSSGHLSTTDKIMSPLYHCTTVHYHWNKTMKVQQGTVSDNE